jgi:hypothetical protein
MVMGWTAELNPSFWITSSGCEYLAPTGVRRLRSTSAGKSDADEERA